MALEHYFDYEVGVGKLERASLICSVSIYGFGITTWDV
jgi:hypothetical protein